MRIFRAMVMAALLGCGGSSKGTVDAAADGSSEPRQDGAQDAQQLPHEDLRAPDPDTTQAPDQRLPGPDTAPTADMRAPLDMTAPDLRQPVDARPYPMCQLLSTRSSCGLRRVDGWVWMRKDGHNCASRCMAPTATGGGQMPVSNCLAGKEGVDQVLCVQDCSECAFE